jgi:hypothetical protein
MRIEKFEAEAANLEPIGQGNENKVFVDPNNEARVIVERRENAEQDTFRQLKGRFYLTKIVHALLPENIPDIYQTTQTSTGQQTIDRERISHSEGHTNLQEVRKSGGDEYMAGQAVNKEMGKSMSEITSKLEEIGLGFNIDENSGNYTKDESGNVYYLETFNPWQADPTNPDGIEILFDTEALETAIEKISDKQTKQNCERYLQRLLILANEEKQKATVEAGIQQVVPEISKLEAAFVLFELHHPVEALLSITTAEEALKSEERKNAKATLVSVFVQMNSLLSENYVTTEQYQKLNEKYQKLNRAIGIINGGMVDHTR